MPSPTSRPQSNLLYATAFAGAVMAVFAVGYRMAGWSWSDAIYMVIITAFSVGFGEVVPITDPWLRAWTMALIVLGCTCSNRASSVSVQRPSPNRCPIRSTLARATFRAIRIVPRVPTDTSDRLS